MNGSFDPSVNLKTAEEELKSPGWKVVKTKCLFIKLKCIPTVYIPSKNVTPMAIRSVARVFAVSKQCSTCILGK